MKRSLHTPAPRSREDASLQVRRSVERAFRAGEVVFDATDRRETFYVIESGEIELRRPGLGRWGILARLGPGEFFGELSLLGGGQRTVRAVAVSDARLLELDGATLESMCLERPEIALRILRRLAVRVTELEALVTTSGPDELVRPVLRALLRRAEQGANGARIPTNLRGLAGEAGLSMLETQRALRHLFERKVVRLHGDVLFVPDLEALGACLDPAD